MRIGIDLDGVVFNSEDCFMSMAELYDYLELGRNSMKKKDEPKVQDKYDWTKEEAKRFLNKSCLATNFSLVPYAKEVIDMLKTAGCEIYFVSARGQFNEEEIEIAMKKLEEGGIFADKYIWKKSDKKDICVSEKIDIMIDDRYDVCKTLSEEKIVCLYFKILGRKQLVESEFLYEVYTWGQIYRIIADIAKGRRISINSIERSDITHVDK